MSRDKNSQCLSQDKQQTIKQEDDRVFMEAAQTLVAHLIDQVQNGLQ